MTDIVNITKEHSRELFCGKIRKILSTCWYERLLEGISTKQLADKAGMTLEEFEKYMSVPEDMNFSILGSLSYALQTEISFDIVKSEKSDDKPIWPAGRPDYTPEEMRILREGFPSEEDRKGWVTIEQNSRKVEILEQYADNPNLTVVYIEDSRHLDSVISCGSAGDGKLAERDIWIKKCQIS